MVWVCIVRKTCCTRLVCLSCDVAIDSLAAARSIRGITQNPDSLGAPGYYNPVQAAPSRTSWRHIEVRQIYFRILAAKTFKSLSVHLKTSAYKQSTQAKSLCLSHSPTPGQTRGNCAPDIYQVVRFRNGFLCARGARPLATVILIPAASPRSARLDLSISTASNRLVDVTHPGQDVRRLRS